MIKKIALLIMALLVVGGGYGQQAFSQVDLWLDAHAAEMGGRLILLVYKDGKVIYNHAVNKMNGRQRALVRLMAERNVDQPDLGDYTKKTK